MKILNLRFNEISKWKCQVVGSWIYEVETFGSSRRCQSNTALTYWLLWTKWVYDLMFAYIGFEWEEFRINQVYESFNVFLLMVFFMFVFVPHDWGPNLSTMERSFGVSSVSLQYTLNITPNTQTITQSRMHMNFWHISWHRVFQDLIYYYFVNNSLILFSSFLIQWCHLV